MAGTDRRFRWLLRLLPGAFREDHEREILRVWRDEMRDGRRGVWAGALRDTLRVAPREHLSTWIHNIRFAGRRLRRSPGFAIAAILTLALGTGATGAVFSLVNAVLLRPLPWRAPEQVGIVWPVQPSGQRTWLSFPELDDLQRAARAGQGSSLSAVEGFTDQRPLLVADGQGQELQALAISHGFFSLLGVAPAIGRDFDRADDRAAAPSVTILSDAFWRGRFGGDPAIVGRTLRLNELDYTVVGVMPPDFAFLPASSVIPDRVDVWLPLEPHLASRDRGVRFLHVLGRLAPGATFARAGEELAGYATRASAEYPTFYRGGAWTFTLVSFQQDVLKNARAALFLLFGLVILVLVMACANVANLLLARGEHRRAELAIRTALGAGPARLAGELLAEAFVLAGTGTILGLAIAAGVPRLLRSVNSAALPRIELAGIDPRVVAFMIGLVSLTAILVSLLPLVERRRLMSPATLSTGRSGGRTARAAALGRGLVFVQTALATTIIVTAVFLGETFLRLQQTDLGFRPDRILTARVTLSPKYHDADAVLRFFDAGIGAIERVPDVRAAAAITQLPLSGAMLGSVFLDGPGPEPKRIDADLRGVTPKYFEVLGMPVRQGRAFDDHDSATSPPVAIVDESFARLLAPDGQVIGRRIRWFRQPDVEMEIVGVVRAVRHRGPSDAAYETVYRPNRQHVRNVMYLTVSTDRDAAGLAASVRAALASVDPSQPFADVSTMAERVDRSLSRARTSVLLAAALAGLALVLGLVGLYGVLSFGVAQRLREFGVRSALGARPSALGALVLREGLLLTGAGVIIGSLGAAIVARLIERLLLATSAGDLQPYAIGAVLVLTCSSIALWLPARRASAADPMSALRSE